MSAETPAAQAVQAVQAKNGMTAPTEPAVSPQADAATTNVSPKTDPAIDALARKERQLSKMRKEIETERAALKAKAQEYETGYVPKSRLTEDPFGVLNEAGLNYDKLTEILLQAPNMNDPAIRALMGKIKALEDKQTASQRASEEAEQKQYTDAIGQISNEVKQLVDSNEAYQMIKESGMAEAVVELIEQTYNTKGTLLDVDDACAQVEEALLVEAERFAKLSKVQTRLAPKPADTAIPQGKQANAPQLKTLTNAVSATPTKRLSDKERVERAKLAFAGKLTQEIAHGCLRNRQ